MDKAEACAAGDLQSPGGSCRWVSQNQQSPSFPYDWQQLAGRSSSTGGGEVVLWVWCVCAWVCMCVHVFSLQFVCGAVSLFFVPESFSVFRLAFARVL